jgi:putative hydrolase of the HAD superfamily
MPPRFFYFDLGKVVVDFSVERMLRQMAAATETTEEQVSQVLFEGGLMRRHEAGQLSSRELYEAFCSAVGGRPGYDRVLKAAAEIFALNLPTLPIVAQLRQAGYPLGVLSNTCQTHWDYCLSHYRIITDGFAVHALSYRIGALKPDAAIFDAAADLADCRPDEIFFVDDVAGHVAGARAVGFDAVQFTTAEALAGELRKRGVTFNY